MNAKSRIIQVIETSYIIGDGTSENPVRIVTAYFKFDGRLIYEHDEFLESLKKRKNSAKDVAETLRKELGYTC